MIQDLSVLCSFLMGLRISPCRRAGAGETAESKQELGGSFIGVGETARGAARGGSRKQKNSFASQLGTGACA